jgi:hypothetical protein
VHCCLNSRKKRPYTLKEDVWLKSLEVREVEAIILHVMRN